MEYTFLKDQLPDKGRDIEGIDKEGKKWYIFRCNHCGHDWRDSIIGSGLILDFDAIVKWKYI